MTHPPKRDPLSGYLGSHDAPVNTMPGTAKAIRVLLFVAAGLTLLVVVGTFLYAGAASTAYTAGAALWVALPGIASLVLALLLRRGGRAIWACLLAVEILYILLALAGLGRGDPRGITNLLLPIVILVLLFQHSSRRYFRRRA